MNVALIFAGGSGVRMNSRGKPKQFLRLYGKEIIIHTLENFQNSKLIDAIIVVCKACYIDFLNKLLGKYELDKVKWVVSGGETGQESICNGLFELEKHCKDDTVVLVHDGVRPFVNDVLIEKCIESVLCFGSAVTVVPAIETIVTIEKKFENEMPDIDGGVIKTIKDRSECFHAKAPQCFFLKDLLAAHRKAIKDGNFRMIDSASLMQFYGATLHTVRGDFDNIKITTPSDFYIFRALYDVQENKQIFGV